MKSDLMVHRRRFLQQAGLLTLAGCGMLTVLPACGNDDPQPKEASTSAGGDVVPTGAHGQVAGADGAAPCGDRTTLSSEALITRQTFKYKQSAENPAKACDLCRFWAVDPKGSHCGTCTLVKGPIDPKGTCMSWVTRPQV